MEIQYPLRLAFKLCDKIESRGLFYAFVATIGDEGSAACGQEAATYRLAACKGGHPRLSPDQLSAIGVEQAQPSGQTTYGQGCQRRRRLWAQRPWAIACGQVDTRSQGRPLEGYGCCRQYVALSPA
ncbi:hypothetical protein B296_00036984 [Ensete ventricosum]|uniref:Uncharacterized protein n=1 Tax=Ensete ventricosum TaxID=4639 RepID=A0A426Z3P4_ENSVE|nr:hypothetical protein B296_00036984 [Ensete ventricosum]